jgi:hypothetical protein
MKLRVQLRFENLPTSICLRETGAVLDRYSVGDDPSGKGSRQTATRLPLEVIIQ